MVDTTEEVKEMGRRKERESREGKKETRERKERKRFSWAPFRSSPSQHSELGDGKKLTCSKSRT